MRYLYILLVLPYLMFSQGISHYNQYPTMHYYTDIDTADISFAYSMRLLRPDYTGPIIQLRRSSDNSTKDFFVDPGDYITPDIISDWAGTDDVFVSVWYDQSSLVRNAIQTDTTKQPKLIFDSNNTPYFQGDGSDDVLIVPHFFDVLSPTKKAGTILGIFGGTKRSQNSFGMYNKDNTNDRWSVHFNWSNNYLYFDPGYCCNGNRSFDNSTGENILAQYTFISSIDEIQVRRQMQNKLWGSVNASSLSISAYFGIGATLTNTTDARGNSTTWFTEMIMYNTDILEDRYIPIEQDQLAFWNL